MQRNIPIKQRGKKRKANNPAKLTEKKKNGISMRLLLRQHLKQHWAFWAPNILIWREFIEEWQRQWRGKCWTWLWEKLDRAKGWEWLKKINTQGEILTLLELMSRLPLTSAGPGFHTKKVGFGGGEGWEREPRDGNRGSKFNIKGIQGKKSQFCLKAGKSRVPATARESQLHFCNPLIKVRLNKTSVTYSALMRGENWM